MKHGSTIMGLFLSMSGVVGGNEAAVIEALREYADDHSGLLEVAELTSEDSDCLIVSEGVGGATILYPHEFMGWDDASQFLSKKLKTPVFSFHIHDGDLWMYLIFDGGELIDQFNPMPEYWGELEDAERDSWRGDASKLARLVPDVSPEQFKNYLVPWGDDVLDSDEKRKAYPSDRFAYGEDWQLTDFMAKFGLDYPMDDRGEPHGTTYRFSAEDKPT